MHRSAPIRVVVADPRHLLRRGLAMLVGHEPDMELAGDAATAADMLAILRARSTDVAVVDTALLGRGGAQLVRAAREASPGVRVLVLTEGGPAGERRAERAGADGHLVKRASSEDLIASIRRVADRLAPAHAAGPDGHGRQVAALPDGDRELLRLIALGYGVGDIADRLALERGQIEQRRAALMRELDAATRAQLVRLADEAGLLGPGV